MLLFKYLKSIYVLIYCGKMYLKKQILLSGIKRSTPVFVPYQLLYKKSINFKKMRITQIKQGLGANWHYCMIFLPYAERRLITLTLRVNILKCESLNVFAGHRVFSFTAKVIHRWNSTPSKIFTSRCCCCCCYSLYRSNKAV